MQVNANSYIFPAQDSTAACAVDVRDGVQAGHQQALFLWSQCDVHSAARLPAQLNFDALSAVIRRTPCEVTHVGRTTYT